MEQSLIDSINAMKLKVDELFTYNIQHNLSMYTNMKLLLSNEMLQYIYLNNNDSIENNESLKILGKYLEENFNEDFMLFLAEYLFDNNCEKASFIIYE